ncbi:MAG: DciA family protein [Terriglobales bacterium]
MESVRDILPALMRQGGNRPEGEALPAAAAGALAWKLAAGEELASRARFADWRAGVLLLQEADAATRAQIESVAPELLRALNRMLPGGKRMQACRRIAFLP